MTLRRLHFTEQVHEVEIDLIHKGIKTELGMIAKSRHSHG